ncbi:unnamed protein product [Symbiodinium natans]|uniref:Uncharacterized protein n=1 Tax=Symbiodinium natans TaxID=878477 RepID=A0A812PGA9_9DINO|nr:unnamed protein product [Symbiodinium natans]
MSAPPHLRPSAQPYIASRRRPSVADVWEMDEGRSGQVDVTQPAVPASPAAPAVAVPAVPVRNAPSSTSGCENTVAVFPSVPREHYRHAPSVGTWMLSLPGRQAKGPGGLEKYTMVRKDGDDARLESLITAASQKASPSFDRLVNPRSAAAVPALSFPRFRPSVGTWLQQRPLAIASPGSQKLQLQDGQVQVANSSDHHSPECRLPSAPSGPSTEKEERLELHFFQLDLSKVDPDAFKKQLMSALLDAGFPQEFSPSITISLRAGVAELRGPVSSMQKLKSLPVYSIQVMGCQAQSAATAAAMAANAGVLPARSDANQDVPESIDQAEEDEPPVLVTAAPVTLPTAGMSSPSAQLPVLTEHSNRGTSAESRTPLLSGTPNLDAMFSPDRRSRQSGFRSHAAPPTERRKAGPQRLRARDRWNVEELRVCDVMSRSLGWTGSPLELDENDVAEILAELYGEELELDAVPWTFQLASRGETRCTSVSDLHYAMRAHHICHFLPQATMRTLATTNVSSRGCVDRELLRDLMEELNGGYTVLAAQVNTVLDEAEALVNSGSGSGRASLVRAISAWYLNVMRTESPWATTFRACYGRWVPENGYHWEVFVRFRSSLKEAEEAFHEDAWQAVWGLLQSAILLLALVFPIMFFAWLVVLGAEHGDDRCPKDLDGLITWFGILGLALIVVGFVDGRLAQEDVVKTSHIGLALSLVLLVLPWVGAFWTFHLDSRDQQTCGLFLTGASSLLWTVCLVSELVLGFAFLWHLAVYQEYEMTLQQGHPPELQAPSYGNRQDAGFASRASEP